MRQCAARNLNPGFLRSVTWNHSGQASAIAPEFVGRPGESASVDSKEIALTRAGALRLDAIDLLRGLVIVLMVLDHVRDYLHETAVVFNPTDLTQTNPILFMTRWVTHLCAPTFVFLSGVSIFMQRANGKAPAELSKFLLTRGLWLILLEFTVVSFGFNWGAPLAFLQVIWAIGASMLLMSLVVKLPARALERLAAPLQRFLLAFGRTPLFTYIVHIYVAHGLALIVGVVGGIPASNYFDVVGKVFGALANSESSSGQGFGLPVVYAVWFAVLLMLYPISAWFAGVKRRRRDWWLSYL